MFKYILNVKNYWIQKLYIERERLVQRYMGTVKWCDVEDNFNRIEKLIENYNK